MARAALLVAVLVLWIHVCAAQSTTRPTLTTITPKTPRPTSSQVPGPPPDPAADKLHHSKRLAATLLPILLTVFTLLIAAVFAFRAYTRSPDEAGENSSYAMMRR